VKQKENLVVVWGVVDGSLQKKTFFWGPPLVFIPPTPRQLQQNNSTKKEGKKENQPLKNSCWATPKKNPKGGSKSTPHPNPPNKTPHPQNSQKRNTNH